MTNKKELAIVLGCTSNMTFALANVILGISNKSSDLNSDFIIFHNGIIEKEQELLKKIVNCNFIEYEFPLKENKKFLESSMKQFTYLMYSRYECFDLLHSYKNIIWLDIDTVVKGNLALLLDYCKGDMGLWLSHEKMQINFTAPLSDYNMYKNSYNSGVIVFKDSLTNFQNMKNWCYDKTSELSEILYCPDQGIINLLIEDFKINVTNLDEKFNCHPSKKGSKNAIILHSYRPEKFWNFWSVREWNENYKQWLKMGGTPTKIKTANLISRAVNAKWPNAPDPVRKPRHFIKFLLNKMGKI